MPTLHEGHLRGDEDVQRVWRFIPVLFIAALAACTTTTTTDCFEWRCELDDTALAKYEAFVDTQEVSTLTFGQKEYRYRLIQWIGEKHFAAAKQGNTKPHYDAFLTFYQTIEAEAGQTLAVYAEIAQARSSGTTTIAEEPQPIFSKDDFIPKIPPLILGAPDPQLTIASNPIITSDNAIAPPQANAGASSFSPVADSLLTRSIAKFTETTTDDDPSEKDLKALIEVASNQGDYNTAFEGLMNFANRDHAHAQYLIGRMYQDGVGIDQNYATAIGWLEKSSNHNWDEAKGALLEMYEVGLGTPTDSKGLVNWHLRAAKLGNPAAQTQVGIYYENGEGITRDPNEAAKWYRRAAQQGNSSAQFLLGWMYAEGLGVELDFIEAYTWFYLASSQGLEDATRLMKMVLGEMTAEQKESAQKRADQRASQLRG